MKKTTVTQYQEVIKKQQQHIEQQKEYYEFSIFGLQPNKNKFQRFLLFLFFLGAVFLIMMQPWILGIIITISLYGTHLLQKRISVQRKFYKSMQSKMMQENNIFLSQISEDINYVRLSPQNIISIEHIIKDITINIQKYSQFIEKFPHAGGISILIPEYMVKKQYRDREEAIIWLRDFMESFSQDLNFWTERHKMELSQLEENIDQQREETILPEGKLALELSQDRISRLTQEADMIRATQK